MALKDVSIIHHIAFMLLILWTLNFFKSDHPFFYVLSLIYLYQVHQRYVMRLTRKLQFEERRSANQRRVLSDSETVRWLNHAVEKIWPLCLEEIVSQKIFLPIVPWFLDKYKPWTVRRAAIQQLYLGRNPPIFTEMRVLHKSSDDDHLVLELGINFLTADDMSAVLAAKLRKRVGFGIVAKMHLTSLHVEGKVLVGVKFIKLPGVAGWLDNLLAMVFEQTLVQPNMLVVDMEKFVSPQQEDWFSVFVRDPVAYARVEIIEATNIIPSDLNGLSDPYVKGQLGSYRFRTKIQKNTLQPKWQEEFKIPLCSWESENVLAIEVRDKDPLVDDRLGVCSVDLSNLRGGKRHDMWISLEDVKMGRMHLAITVIEANTKVTDRNSKDKKSHASDNAANSSPSEMSEKGSSPSRKSKQHKKVDSTYEPIDVKGQKETGLWLHRPGSDLPSVWEPRKGKSKHRSDTEILRENNAAVHTPKSTSTGSMDTDFHSDENMEGNQMSGKKNIIKKGLQKINTALHRNQKKEDFISRSLEMPTTPSTSASVKFVDRIGVKLVVEDIEPIEEPSADNSKGQMREKAKNILKQAGKSARQLKYALSRKGMGSKPSTPIGLEAEGRGNEDDRSSSSNTDEDSSPSSSLYEQVESPPPAYPLNCRDQVPVTARDPLAAVSYFSDDNAEASMKNTLYPNPLQESVFHDAR
ncbi:hypothetical protein V2J09_015281 [Rumex salicifolius]